MGEIMREVGMEMERDRTGMVEEMDGQGVNGQRVDEERVDEQRMEEQRVDLQGVDGEVLEGMDLDEEMDEGRLSADGVSWCEDCCFFSAGCVCSGGDCGFGGVRLSWGV